MKVGLQTISWGSQIDNIQALAETAQQLGYQGIEFAQRVETLPSSEGLALLLKEHDLAFVGFAGGCLSDRISYASRLSPCYLYTDEWDEAAIREAIGEGFIVGLHPHKYKDIDTIAKAEPYLVDFPELGLILDTAHLHLTGDDVVQGFRKHEKRVLAIHMKDWTDRFGTAPLRFARGFAALGRGVLGSVLEDMVSALLDSSYDGWVIVEQDSPDGNPEECARISREWLHNHGI